ncbi:terminase [Rhodococcus sp. D2-41]|uniref:terminase n=1 Tax=Speluncibacter jeojiensis TaxID=2710754 RepID=UPI0024108A5A|nr:terminase [Rhodococcus sp. D2-41]MDG3012468.1 terminase [Rhodococcus sp. D2-41]
MNSAAEASTAAADRLCTLPDGVPKLTLGWEALAFAAKYLRHPNGIRAGQRWQYTPGQARFLLWWYAVDENGRWLYYHGARRLSKGSGKSPFAAAYALTEFCGPVRLRDFDPSLPGGCKGRRVDMPLVQIAATSLDQTANTMRQVRAMATKGSRIVTDFQLDPGRMQYNMLPEGTLQVITSSAATAEGAEATAVIADETEHWLPANGGPELASTLIDNLTKSGNRMLETANAPKPGKGSVIEDTFDSWCKQEDGKTRDDRQILLDARIAPPETDLADEESLRRGLEWVYADCPWANIDAIITRIWSPKSRPDDSKRKYLNWPTAPGDAWADPQQWATLADPDVEVAPGERIAMFFDGSKSRDDTALIGCRISDGHVFTLGVWSPTNSHSSEDQTPVVDVEAVDARVEWAFDTYQVAAFFADVKEWEGFAKVTWPGRYRDRLSVWAMPSGKAQEPIAWDMRSHDYDFTMAAELVEAEIREAAFTHDGNADLSRHVRNARRRDGRWGISVRKETPNSADKIDACVCLIGARMARRIVLTSGKEKERSNDAMFV